MSSSNSCTSCKSKSLVRDDVTGNLVCDSCGLLQEFDSYEANYGGIAGPEGTFVRVGTSGTGSVLDYKEKKIYEAQKLIQDIMYRLELSGSKSKDVTAMVSAITEGEFGQGQWLTVLIGACAYVVMRKDNRSLPIAEVASVIGCDDHELGRMVLRVVDHLNLKQPDFPEFDIVGSFERALKESPSFVGVGKETAERMRKQGIFLMQCAVKWFLTTGRKPLPVVAAVLVLVAKLNHVDVRIENVAKQVHAVVHTSKLRYKELLEELVKVAQALPWGKDVTRKNIVKNAPFVIQYMEKKSMSKPGEKRKDLVNGGFDLEGVVSECLSKEIEYGTDGSYVEDDSRYFEVEDFSRFALHGVDDVEKLKLSPECLSMIYKKFSNEIENAKSGGEIEEFHGRKKWGFEDLAYEWWNGKSELSKKLLLKQILDNEVGLDALPPSFENGCRAYERRREKINAAKLRINRIMNPSNPNPCDDYSFSTSENIQARKKRKRGQTEGIDWEDLIIEKLLLHKVKEEEIEKGYYNTLLDLYVFNSGIV
ncbi:plant-specific TFIIB-related protein PTF2 isoform X1 [Ziziphus jujuba]|uniref:Plant-specific TFIIB-related protein PTF2 isoform X1 n=2 Tax=Ziziphus jujuba TaxID=326968 RepID=A0A6P3ZLL1_ZIZJJ|nr:plant-specific TFIIB-related protein PTF2 isoform X1 [Ziziphus jujuba]KAH7544965.1 hypothetical protein FEM48_Zijuj01G0042100 [Ziziphus jujuba var. spinosa]